MEKGFKVMKENIVKEYVVIKKEGAIQSLVQDTFTFGGFIALLWFNHTYLDGNGWLDVLFIFGWFLTLAAMSSSRYKTFRDADSAIKHLEELK
jgi:hypothetical protein